VLSIFAAFVLAAGVIVTLHPRFHFGFITELCIALSAMFAGGFVMGQSEMALFYCIIASLTGVLYYTLKTAYAKKHPAENRHARN
jgi:hypothetical protein